MPTRRARTGPEKARGDLVNVRLDYEGLAKLSSRNYMPNPDWRETDQKGRVRYWDLVGREQAAGWWAFVADGPGEKFKRQGTTELALRQAAYRVEDDVLPGPEPLAPGAPNLSELLAPEPGEVQLVPITDLGYGAGVYWLTIAFILLVKGIHTDEKYRVMTGYCEPLRVVLTAGQSFNLKIPDMQKPDGAVAMVVGMCPRNAGPQEFYCQDVYSLKYRVPEKIPMRGPFRRGFKLKGNNSFVGPVRNAAGQVIVSASGEVNTDVYGARREIFPAGTPDGLPLSLTPVDEDHARVSSDEPRPFANVAGLEDLVSADAEGDPPVYPAPEPVEVPALKWAYATSPYILERGAYRGALVVRRKYGWSEDGPKTETIRITEDRPGEMINFYPEILPLEAEEWAVTLEYDPDPNADFDDETDGSYLDSIAGIAADGGASGNALGGNDRKRRVKRGQGGATEAGEPVGVQTGKPEKNPKPTSSISKNPPQPPNLSGVEDPDISLEEITADDKFTESNITPGIKYVKWSWATEDGGESLSSRAVKVEIPSGPGGVATHTLRIKRPPNVNEIDNPLLEELKQDDVEYAWERLGAVTHSIERGIMLHNDTSGSNADAVVRRDSRVNVSDKQPRTMKFDMDFPRYVSGQAEAYIECLNVAANGTTTSLSLIPIGAITADRKSRKFAFSIGPASANLRYTWPATTTHIRRVFYHVGSDPDDGVRNFTLRIQNVGQVPGYTHAFKRHPKYDPKRQQFRPREEPERADVDYPGFGYTAVLEDIDDSPWDTSDDKLGRYTFEDGALPNGFSQALAGGGAVAVVMNGITGDYSFRSADNDTTNGTAQIVRNFGAFTNVTDTFLFEARKAPQQGDVEFYSIKDASNNEMAQLFARGVAGPRSDYYNVWLRITDAGGVVSNYLVARKVLPGEEFLYHLELNNGNSANNGNVKLYVGEEHRQRTLVINQSGFNFTNKRGTIRRIGGRMLTANPNATYTFLYDTLEMWATGDAGWTQIDSDVVEIWSPTGSIPAEIGPQGCRVPVKGDTQYCFSYYLWWRGITRPAYPLTITVRDESGEILQRVGSASPGIKGRGYWRRVNKPFFTHEDAAYIEFSGTYADGCIRLAALQLDYDRDTPSAYTNRNALTGTLTMIFDLRVPGMPSAWPGAHQNAVAKFRRAGYVGQYEPGTTGISIRYATCPDIENAVWSAWASTIGGVPVPSTLSGGLKIEATLTTNDPTESPELRELWADFARKTPTICRGDGREYIGGAVPVDFQPRNPQKNIAVRLSADNTESFSVYGNQRVVSNGWWIEAYSDEGSYDLMEDQAEAIPGMDPDDAGTYRVEDPDIEGGSVFVVRFFNAAFSVESRDVSVRVPGYDAPLYMLASDSIEASVLSREKL